jgi:leucyl aminopeptidase
MRAAKRRPARRARENTETKDKSRPATARVVLPVFEETRRAPAGASLEGATAALVDRALQDGAFRGEVGQTLVLFSPAPSSSPPLVLLGLGPEGKLGLEQLRRAFGSLARRARREGIARVQVLLDGPHLARSFAKMGWKPAAHAVRLAWEIGSYSFDAYKSPAKEVRRAAVLELRLPRGTPAASEGDRTAQRIAEAVNYTRDLTNTPANDLYPEKLAGEARRLARRLGLRFQMLDERQLRKERMGCLLGVAQGSDRAPCLFVIEYPGPRAPRRKVPTLCLVGKAITFDSGGLSIKPAKGMEEMKFDMSGGAAVLGVLHAVAQLKPDVRVVGVVPSAENLIGGSAMRPGDIIRSASGKTIEVLNTDAEGRLILADALHYAQRYRPDYVLDFATLTGACLVALGTQVSGMVSNDTAFARKVFEAGERSGERVWQLPLYDEFLEATKSQVADLKNSAGRNGGAITAAAFLSQFVGKTPWCHLDVAGTAWTEKEIGGFIPGATGVGVRLVIELLSTL